MEKKLKVLFVCSGNSSSFEISPFIYVQGESLRSHNIEIDYFCVIGKGIRGYLENIKPLRLLLKTNKYDLIHAHYGLSCWVALLTFTKITIIVSLMGSDVYGDYYSDGRFKYKSLCIIIFSKLLEPFVKHIIVKSENILNSVIFKRKCTLIPNGVNINEFQLFDKSVARNKFNFRSDERIIIFLGNPYESRKNVALVKKAINMIEISNIKLLLPYPVEHSRVPYYLNAADVLVLASLNEGSPNVIKEAMACNCPIVSTDVGDVRWVIGATEGCYLSSFEPTDFAAKIELALAFREKYIRTKGRERIIELGLDYETVAFKIINIYKKVLSID